MEEVFQKSTFNEYKEYLSKVKADNCKVRDAYSLLDDDDEKIDLVLQDQSLNQREIIEIIALCRRANYAKTAGGANKAAENETDRLYAKNPWKFVEEFLQNADDCNYSEIPQIDIVINEKDEKHPFIEFTYNEDGFSRNDIWAITAFSESTKVNDTVEKQNEEGVFYKEKTGRKGKGFKAVFSLNAENIIVHIRSNGFSFKLDNKIGRIMPIWENDSARMDGKTHVIVEIVNPNFGTNSVKDIYPEFKRLFCVESRENIFASSPFLFMHRMKSVHITRINSEGEEDFITDYREDTGKTVYKNPITIDKNMNVLAGIASKGIYYREQFQTGDITTLVGDEIFNIPVLRYTRMVEDDNSYRNYSIMAPIITGDSEIEWSSGALFRTFPMSLHPINMPLAIDAPFILNPDRSGIQYIFKAEDGTDIQADVWNTAISNRLFEDNGIVESFFMWIRSIEDIRIDKYMRQEEVVLFRDQNNSDGHGNTWVPLVDISELCHKYPVFRLFAKNDEYVCFNQAQTVKKDLFTWPHVKSLFSLLIGKDYENYILSDLYIGSNLFNAKPIVKQGFADAMNDYIDEVESDLEIDSQDMFSFINNKLYPYLKENYKLISQIDSDAFKTMCIYFSRLQKNGSEIVIREAYREDVKWFVSDHGEKITSINRYRVIDSSPVNVGIIKQIISDVFGNKKLCIEFQGRNQNIVAKQCKSWEKIRDYIEAIFHFGYEFESLKFPSLSKYVFSENLDPAFNPFREAEILEIIPDGDVQRLSSCFGNVDNTIEALRTFGVKASNDYFVHEGNYLGFNDDTLKVLKSDKCPDNVLDDIKSEKIRLKKDINTTYESIRDVQEKALIYFLNESNGLFTTESYADICDHVQEDEEYWNRNDDEAKEILVRACSGATKTISKKEKRSLSIALDEVLNRKLEDCIFKIARKNRLGLICVENFGLFEAIAEEEISPLLRLLKPDETVSEAKFYKGNLHVYGGNEVYIQDGKGGNVYLQTDENGDYKSSLEAYADKSFDTEALRYIDEMELQYQKVKEDIIVPIFNKTGHRLSDTYDEVERRFDQNNKKEIINILSWFRYSGYTNAFGNGNISNEKEIEDDYRNDPWKFVYEFIQNVDDCSFGNRKPELSINIESKDRIVFEYNEDGFSLDDIKALTKFGDSNKKGVIESTKDVEGLFDREKTGRKGRGFKSVFALPGNGIVVHICSNGFSFKFVKRLGSIIPIWEDIEDAPQSGTRIIVEGFEQNYTQKLIGNIRSMFGVENLQSFFSICPMLYLRKLNKVNVCCLGKSFSIDIEPIEQTFGEKIHPLNRNTVAGIIHEGEFRKSLWEKMLLSIVTDGKEYMTEVVRYSCVFSIGNLEKIGSIYAPIIDKNKDLVFESGALFRTLPLDEHKIRIPLAINAPFETNSGRSAIEDASEINQGVLAFAFGELIEGFYNHLKTENNIRIEKYIPTATEVLFKNYKKQKPVDLQSVVKKIPILKSYSGDSYVACINSKVLLEECYEWTNPQILSECFDEGSRVLVAREYSNLHIARYLIDFRNAKFVENINRYLDEIDVNDNELYRLLQDKIYPYIDRNYEEILKKYREIDKKEELKQMKIFGFTMSDGSVVRETADEKIYWMTNETQKYFSFGKFRCVGTSSLCDKFEQYRWLKELHEVIDFEKAFTSERLSGNRIRDWQGTAELIETLLYYDVQKDVRIPFLSNCVLSEEYDHVDNVFRDGYLETENPEILEHIIDKEDLEEIREKSGIGNDQTLEKLAEKIKSLGLKTSDGFFDDGNKGIFDLNESSKALLCSYCDTREKSENVITKIGNAFGMLKQGKNAHLNISFEDIEDCHDSVFSIIFAHELIGYDLLRGLAEEYCNQVSNENSLDSIEAYFRAVNIIGKVPSVRNINISLSEILRRGLGECVQNCKLINDSDLKLNIEIDVEVADYPSQEIEQALRWLNDDETAVSVSYEYYTADISQAFGSVGNEKVYFLYDDEKVIINATSAKNSMLDFVKKRYKGKDASFSALVSIISEQNELKGIWKKTKKEYIERLARFRKDTWQKQEVLFPDYDKHLNDANSKAIDYVLPELLQNINDCLFGENQEERILNVGMDVENGKMLLQYDEAGFDFSNVYSITAIGQSTKHDESEGEKGLGFKKVFTLFEQVEIYSNEFSFRLSSEKYSGTFPEWIGSKEKLDEYMLPGKTTMIFSAPIARKKKLEEIHDKWKKLMDGEYVGSTISPLFLKNISQINLSGYSKQYSRKDMEREFIFKKEPLIAYYGKLLQDNDVSDPEEKVKEIIERLKTRRKCKAMTADEKDVYINSLTIEVGIPKKSEKYVDKGCFYSTLPTESMLHAAFFINIPLELTTGRDGIVDSSEFNEAIMEMLLGTVEIDSDESNNAVFYSLVEAFAEENQDISMLDYFITNYLEFSNAICKVSSMEKEIVNSAFENLRIFKKYNSEEMVSLAESYSMDSIVCLYLNEVGECQNDIEEWIGNHIDKVNDLSLIMPQSRVDCEKLEKYATVVNSTEGYFPITDKDHDYAVEYMMDEYGYIGGDLDE